MNQTKRTLTQQMTLAALFITLTVILSNVFSTMIPLFGFPSLMIDVGTIGLMVGSIVLGPLWGLVLGISSDLIGYFTFRAGYPLYFGFTLNAAMIGLSSGLIFKGLSPLPKRTISIMTYALLASLFGFSLFFISYISSIESPAFGGGVTVYDLSSWSLKLTLMAIVFGSFVVSLGLLKGVQHYFAPDTHLFYTIVLMVTVLEIVVSMGLSSLWILDMYGVPYFANFFVRIIRGFPLIPLKAILVYLVIRLIPHDSLNRKGE